MSLGKKYNDCLKNSSLGTDEQYSAPTDWSDYPAESTIDANGNNLTGVSSLSAGTGTFTGDLTIHGLTTISRNEDTEEEFLQLVNSQNDNVKISFEEIFNSNLAINMYDQSSDLRIRFRCEDGSFFQDSVVFGANNGGRYKQSKITLFNASSDQNGLAITSDLDNNENYCRVVRGATTNGAQLSVLYELDVDAGATVSIDAVIHAHDISGSTNNCADYRLNGICTRNDGNTLALVVSNTTTISEFDPGLNTEITTASNTLRIVVAGVAGSNLKWAGGINTVVSTNS